MLANYFQTFEPPQMNLKLTRENKKKVIYQIRS